MPNVVEIQIKGNDQSKAVLDRASTNTKRLSNDMKALGGTVGQVGNAFSIFGNQQVAGALNSIDSAILSTRGFTKDLNSSKIAIAGLGIAALTAGYQVGEFIRQFIPFFNDDIIANRLRDATDRINEVMGQRLTVRDPERGGDAAFEATINKRIAGIKMESMAEREKSELIFQLEMLKNETLEKNASDRAAKEQKEFDDGTARYNEFYDGLFLKLSELSNAELAQFQQAEMIQMGRLEKAREFYQQGIIDEQQFHAFSQVAFDTYEKEKTRIAKEQSDIRQKKLEEERKKNLLAVSNYISAAGSIFGSLATIAETQGKKAFKFTQALRYVEAIVNTAAGVARALAEYPWPYSLAVAATVAAVGAAQIATIASQKPPQAHAGASYIPEESTYLLSKGERVLAPRENEDFTNFMRQGGGGNGYDIDGRKLGTELFNMSRDGRLKIDGRCIV